MTEKKDLASVSFTLPAKLKQEANQRAHEKGLTLSPYIRNLIIKDLEMSQIRGLKHD